MSGSARPGASPPCFPPAGVAFAIWGLAAALYLAGFFQRVAPAVITRELTAEFALGAAALGNLAAVYYYSYVAIQIPAGVMADRWGPRRVLAAGAAVAAAGTLLFALAGGIATALAGRFLIGASVGVAFVSMLKLASHWFAAQRFAMLSGLALATGILGAISAGLPLRLAVDAFGWRAVLGAAGMATGVLAVAIWLFVRDDPGERGYASHAHAPASTPTAFTLLGSVRRALTAPNAALVFFIGGGVSGPTLTFAGLWGVPFLVTHYGLTTAAAATVTSLLMASWALGAPVMGSISDRLRRRKPIYVGGTGLALAGWSVVFLVPGLPFPLLVVLLVATGVVSSCAMVGFAIAKESAPAPLAGTAVGVANMGNMLGGMVMPPVVGWVLDRSWDGAMAAGARVYEFDAYRAGFAPMLAWLVLALVLAVFTRETYCRQTQ